MSWRAGISFTHLAYFVSSIILAVVLSTNRFESSEIEMNQSNILVKILAQRS